jgi:hypothetical protein
MNTIRNNNLEKIKEALRAGLRVYASMSEDGQGLVVRSARRHQGRVQVLTVEGWRQPVEVWTEGAAHPCGAPQV